MCPVVAARKPHSVFLSQDEKKQFLSQAMKDKRIYGAVKLLNKLKYPFQPNMLWFFSDEKYFCQAQIANPQNNCCLVQPPRVEPIRIKTKQPLGKV